uniref:NADP-dependent oxidoreductase domain-containing protein n=1 Tax=Odontella aurita TaxID=265563 RepID=A0A7S4K2J8_9STRA
MATGATPRVPLVTLSNGVEMPRLAFGTAPLVSKADADAGRGLGRTNPNFNGFLPEQAYRSVTLALESGLRHIDTAVMYRSHKQISHVLGNFFASGRLRREDVFLTSKIMHPPNDGFGTDDSNIPIDDLTPEEVGRTVSSHFERTLSELGVGYVDLMLLHWPAAWYSRDSSNPARRLAAWRELERYYEKGWARSIGVSNFSVAHLQQLMDDGAVVRPMVNQIEASVHLQRTELISYCKEKGIVVEAYSPLGRGTNNILVNPIVLKIAEKKGKNPGQVALRYLIQKGMAVVFLSSSEERIRTNQDVFDFELDELEMEELTSLNRPDGTWGLPAPHDMS